MATTVKPVAKADLVKQIAKASRRSQAEVKDVLEGFQKVTTRLLKKPNVKVSLNGFLTIQSRKKDERIAKNPSTGDKVKVPAHNAVSIKAGKSLKDAVRPLKA